jgi:hypothetical protein
MKPCPWVSMTLAFMFLVVTITSAQVTTASLSGTVTDESKAVLPGATITATDLSTRRQYVGVTDERGEYRLPNVAPGRYHLRVELVGFAAVEAEGVELLVGQSAVRSFTLGLATLQESVTVSGETPLIDTRSSQVAGNVDRRQMELLPLQGRNWMSLSMLVKGITANDVSTSPGVGRDELFQLNLDGQQVTQKLGQARYGQPKFSRESIAEFQLVTQLFDITQGRSTGIQVQAVTKSGANDISGSAFGYFRHEKLNAPDHLAKRVLPYSNQQVGGSLGGPIIRDKVHYFASYEYEREPSTAISTPTFLGGQVFSFPSENTNKSYFARGDYHTERQGHLSVRWTNSSLENPFANTAGNRHPSGASIQTQDSTNVLGTWSRVLGSTMAAEIRVGYNGFSFGNLNLPELDGTPNYGFPGISIGPATNQPNIFYQRTYQGRGDLSWFAGDHDMKIGAEFLRIHDTGYWSVVGAGRFVFNTRPPDLAARFPADAWNDPSRWNLVGLDAHVQRWDQNFREDWNVDMPRPTVGVWAGDTWRMNNRLTVNFGVRWDADFGVADPPGIPETTILIDNGRVSGDFGYKRGHTDLDNFSPRAGFVLKALGTDDFVIRGGGGRYYSFAASNVMYIKELYGTMVSASIPYDGRPGFVLDPLRGLTGSDFLSGRVPLPPQTKTVLDPNFQNPYTWQYSIGFQKQLGPVMSFDADLVGWEWYQDQRNNDVNLFYDPANGYNKDPRIFGRPNPAYAQVVTVRGEGKRDYLALATSFNRRLRNNFQAGLTYTYMFHMRDDNLGGSGAIGSTASNPFDHLDGEWARSTDFQRHTFRSYWLYQLPWQLSLSGVYFYGSGNYYSTTLSSLAYNGGGANRLNLGPPISVPADVQDRFEGPPVIGTGDVVPRNALKGFSLHRVDLRVAKDIPLGQRLKITAIAEVFNVTNHANYGSYVGTVDSTSFGQPVAVASFSGLGTAYVPRSGQLAFRVSF